MIRRLNYTGRIKIGRRDIHISTRETAGALAFDAALSLSDYALPADALVFVEAYRTTTWMRFPFGTVANFQPPPEEQRRLVEFDSPDGVLFRVKVTSARDAHILLAAADHIPLARPDGDADRDSLLEVVPKELGDELWQLDLDNEPRLFVSKSATADWRQMALSPVFLGLVYPAVLRLILENILIEHEYRDTEDEGDWRSRWLRFAKLLPGMEPEPPGEADGSDIARRWADDAAAMFAKNLALKAKFAAAWHSKESA